MIMALIINDAKNVTIESVTSTTPEADVVKFTPPATAGSGFGTSGRIAEITNRAVCNAINGRYISSVTRKNFGKCSMSRIHMKVTWWLLPKRPPMKKNNDC